MQKQQAWLHLLKHTGLLLLYTRFLMFFQPLAGLSHAFQKHDIDFTVVRPLVIGTKAAIDALHQTPGENFSSLPDILPELEKYSVQQSTNHLVQQFRQNVHNKYLTTISQDI